MGTPSCKLGGRGVPAPVRVKAAGLRSALGDVVQERLPRRAPPPNRLPGHQQLAEIDAVARRMLVKRA